MSIRGIKNIRTLGNLFWTGVTLYGLWVTAHMSVGRFVAVFFIGCAAIVFDNYVAQYAITKKRQELRQNRRKNLAI